MTALKVLEMKSIAGHQGTAPPGGSQSSAVLAIDCIPFLSLAKAGISEPNRGGISWKELEDKSR